VKDQIVKNGQMTINMNQRRQKNKSKPKRKKRENFLESERRQELRATLTMLRISLQTKKLK
jgi:hypothetical protein